MYLQELTEFSYDGKYLLVYAPPRGCRYDVSSYKGTCTTTINSGSYSHDLDKAEASNCNPKP